MKKVLAFGCSNTGGAEAINDYDEGIDDDNINKAYAYPKYIADLLGYGYDNYAENGISNQQIASKVFEVIANTSDIDNIFVVIGWTDDCRIAVSRKQHNNIRSTNNFIEMLTISYSHVVACTKTILKRVVGIHETNRLKDMQDFNAEFIYGIAERIFSTKNYSDTNFFIKYATACFLEEKKIQYLTLPTLCNPYNSLYNAFFNSDKQKNNIQEYNNNGKLSFNFFKRFKAYGVSTSGEHLKAEAHKHVGQYLYDYIINNKIIK
jgi:hypothetical protein